MKASRKPLKYDVYKYEGNPQKHFISGDSYEGLLEFCGIENVEVGLSDTHGYYLLVRGSYVYPGDYVLKNTEGNLEVIRGLVFEKEFDIIGENCEEMPNVIGIRIDGKELGQVAVKEINKYHQSVGYSELNI